jgi:hypothetical protein
LVFVSPLSPIGNGIAGRNNAWWALTERPYSRAGRFLQLIRRFAALAVQAENMEAKLALGLEINLADHALVSSTLVRLASRLGINRHSKVVALPLRDYLEARAAPTAEGVP